MCRHEDRFVVGHMIRSPREVDHRVFEEMPTEDGRLPREKLIIRRVEFSGCMCNERLT